MRVLLDTVAFIVAVESPELLGRRAQAVFAGDGNRFDLSALSLTEIAVKTAKGKLELTRHDIEQGLADLRVQVLAYTRAHAFRLLDLAWHPPHVDPFDRQIIAQALVEDIPVLTSDESFRLYPGLKVLW